MLKFSLLGGHKNGQDQFEGSRAVFDGNSLTFGGYPSFVQSRFNSDGVTLTVVNVGVNGQTTAQMAADAGTEIDPYWVPNKPNLLVAYEIGNDLSVSFDPTGAYNRFKQYCLDRRAAALANDIDLRIVVLTCTPRINISDIYFNPANQLLRDNYRTFSNALADLRTDARLLNPNDSTYYTDGTHYTDAGKQVVSLIVYNAIKRL